MYQANYQMKIRVLHGILSLHQIKLLNFLSELAKKANADEKIIQSIKKANTARHVSEIIKENSITGFFELICSETYKHMRKHSEEKVPIDVILFDFEGEILARES